MEEKKIRTKQQMTVLFLKIILFVCEYLINNKLNTLFLKYFKIILFIKPAKAEVIKSFINAWTSTLNTMIEQNNNNK